ncbi:hypothetical protein Taro_019043 [Colocasia esculenta]|uniref:Uncharacterized protein n=1 Tax=Colocasia esculenta TaxID=4460 RepID=A0A843UY30_COLES|nr:hypothetical protein [Colocasia esculenta]
MAAAWDNSRDSDSESSSSGEEEEKANLAFMANIDEKGAHHSCPAPSDSSGSSSLPEKGQDDRNTYLYEDLRPVDVLGAAEDEGNEALVPSLSPPSLMP